MRLWPLAIINQLPRQHLLGQHRECCALRGMGWGRKHSTVDYVFTHPYYFLYEYHRRVMDEMTARGYRGQSCPWYGFQYRGKKIGKDYTRFTDAYSSLGKWDRRNIYFEHDEKYLDECIANLAAKGVHIDREWALAKMKAS